MISHSQPDVRDPRRSRDDRRPARVVLAIAALFLILGAPESADAYVGPGAGFALLSSFLVLFTTTVAAIVSLLFWPFRMLWRRLRGGTPPRASIRRLVIVGLDGQDPMLTDRFMAAGSAAELQEACEGWLLPASEDDVSVGVAGGVVVVQHWHAARTAQHLRFPRSRSPHVPASAVVGVPRQRQAVLHPGTLPDSAREARAAPAAQIEAVLGRARRAPDLEHHPARPDHVSAGSLLRRRAERDVGARPARHAGDLPAVHHAFRLASASRRAARECPSPSRATASRRQSRGRRIRLRPTARPLRVRLAHCARSVRAAGGGRLWRHACGTHAGTTERLGHAAVPGRAGMAVSGITRLLVIEMDDHFSHVHVAHQPRSREAGDAGVAPALLLDVPGQADRPVRDARARRGYVGAQRRRHSRGHLPAAGVRHRSRAPGDVLLGAGSPANGRAGVRVRRDRSHPAHVLAVSRSVAPGAPRRNRARIRTQSPSCIATTTRWSVASCSSSAPKTS